MFYHSQTPQQPHYYENHLGLSSISTQTNNKIFKVLILTCHTVLFSVFSFILFHTQLQLLWVYKYSICSLHQHANTRTYRHNITCCCLAAFLNSDLILTLMKNLITVTWLAAVTRQLILSVQGRLPTVPCK